MAYPFDDHDDDKIALIGDDDYDKIISKDRCFQDLFKGGEYCNLDYFSDAVVIAQDGVEFRVHKIFLSKGSEYFHAFFRGNFGQEGAVTLPFYSEILENILIYLYTYEIYRDTENVAALIIAADYLIIEDLLIRLKYFALRNVTVNCSVSLLNASYVVDRLEMTKHFFRFVQVHFERIVRQCDSDIAELHFRVFRDLLKNVSLGASDEDTVWKAIVIWVEGETKDRLKHVPELLSCIRWNAMSSSLASCIATHSIFRENEFCKSMNLEELIKAPEQQTVMNTARCPRKMYLFVVRKRDSYSYSSIKPGIYLTYDDQLNLWRKIGETDANFTSLIAIGRFVFMFNTVTSEMETFDLFNKQFHRMSNCNTSRKDYHVAQCQGAIFAVGGYMRAMSSSLLTRTNECYEPATDVWTCIAQLLPTIHICGASVVDEKLCVIGYIENIESLEMKAFVYDRVHNVWTNISSPQNFRTNFALINFDERLHILGGRKEDFRIFTALAEVYYSEEDEWKYFPDLPFPYEQPKAVILKNTIMVYECYGGATSDNKPCMWNVLTQSWDVDIKFYSEVQRYPFCCIDDQQILKELMKQNRDQEVVWTRTPFEHL